MVKEQKIEEVKRQYIQGKLTPEEAAEFETYFIDKPELLEELELDMMLKKHLPAVSFEQDSVKSNWFSWLMQPLTASVATAIFCVGSFTLYLQSQDEVFEGSGKVNLVYISPMRDSSEQPHAVVSTGKGDEQITLVLQPTVMEATEFNIKLLDPQGNQAVLFENVSIQGMGDLVVTLPSQLLKRGDWTFEVSPIDQPELLEKLVLRSEG